MSAIDDISGSLPLTGSASSPGGSPSRGIISRCGLVILAAGSSSRLGRPKQLLGYNGQSLLRHMVAIAISWRSRGDQAVRADAHPIIVVLGANGGLISKEIQPALKPPADSTVPLAFSDGLQNEDIHLVFNEEWSEGIASSIRSGIMALREADPSADGVILAVCDQPHITADLLNELITTQVKTGLPIVASAYEGATGTPVLFHRSMFPELMTLKGDIGAKKLIHQYADSVATVPFPGGGMDIDTDADYKALLD